VSAIDWAHPLIQDPVKAAASTPVQTNRFIIATVYPRNRKSVLSMKIGSKSKSTTSKYISKDGMFLDQINHHAKTAQITTNHHESPASHHVLHPGNHNENCLSSNTYALNPACHLALDFYLARIFHVT
jgi:hypothetical protein